MKIVVADSSSLILLAKIEVLDVFSKNTELYIPTSVFDECVRKVDGKKYPSAQVINELVEAKQIMVSKVVKNIKLPLQLGKGEEDAIKLMIEIKADLLACDDGKAIKICRFLKLPFIVTPKIVSSLYTKKMITLKKAKESLENLQIFGRYSPDIIARAFLELQGGE